MIQIDETTKKFSKIYHTIDDINNFSLRIRIVDESSPDEQDTSTFKWQQKRFSHQEREKYQNVASCHTELEKQYHQSVLKSAKRPSKASIIFSYTSQDNFHPPEYNSQRRSRKHPTKPDESQIEQNPLQKLINNLSLNECNEENIEEHDENVEEIKEYDYFEYLKEKTLVNNLKKIPKNENSSEHFYIMADFGEFYNSTWIAAEYILCAIKYDRETRKLMITPDFTIFGGYELKVTADETKSFVYYVENASLDATKKIEENQEVLILNQMNSTVRKSLNHSQQFQLEHMTRDLPEKSKYVYVILEILSGCDFVNDNIFVKYSLVLNDWQLKTPVGDARDKAENHQTENALLEGVTFASRGFPGRNQLNFGFPLEWHFIGHEYVQKDPVVHFELISKDTWSRFRSEGATQYSLPLKLLGRKIVSLPCCRTTSSGVGNSLRRFFIGDCSNYQSLTQTTTNGMNCLNTTTMSSGTLKICVDVMLVQNGGVGRKSATSFETLREITLRERLQDPQLTKTVDKAVEAFKRARDALLEAREAV